MILNLLSNARKHTDEGTRVTAGLAVDAAHREAVVTVTDNGPGITPDFLPKIFDRFTRADKARSGSDGTTGLGLAIVQAIVQAHGGSIQVQSQPGHTVFTVRLPLEAGARLMRTPRWLTRWLARWFAERVVGWVFGRSGGALCAPPLWLAFFGFYSALTCQNTKLFVE